MGIQVNLGVGKRSSQLLHAVGRAPFCQFIRKILRVICSAHRGVKSNDTSRVTSPLKAQPESNRLQRQSRLSEYRPSSTEQPFKRRRGFDFQLRSPHCPTEA